MKAVFFHDARLKYIEEGTYYTSGGLTQQYLNRYLDFYDRITLVTRKEKISSNNIFKYSITSGKNIYFNCIEKLNVFSLFFGKDKRIIQNEIKNNDFVIIRLPSIIGITACHFSNKYSKKYMIEVVGCTWDSLWNYGGIKAKLVAPIMYLLNRYYIKKAPNVLYVSNKFLQKRYPNKKHNIGCSDVNIENLSEEILNKRIKKINSKKINKNEIKIGLIGSLNVNYKGHEAAIKAISILKEYNIDIKLHCLGAGDKNRWSEIIKKYNVEENIYFDGTLPAGEEVYKWLDNLDIFWIPSLTEGFPRALVEAMSRALPAIGTNVGGIPELINNDYLIEKNDYKDLANKTIQIINNRKSNIDIAKENFKKSLNYEKKYLDKKRKNFYFECIK